MNIFLSKFTNKVDGKGRVSLPAPFRKVVASESFSGVVLYPSFVNQAIEGCSSSRIEQISSSIDALEPYSEERDAFATSILGECEAIMTDGDGRILIPKSLLSKAEITDQALFIGKGATFEIWQPERFAEYAKRAQEIARDKRSILRLNIAK